MECFLSVFFIRGLGHLFIDVVFTFLEFLWDNGALIVRYLSLSLLKMEVSLIYCVNFFLGFEIFGGAYHIIFIKVVFIFLEFLWGSPSYWFSMAKTAADWWWRKSIGSRELWFLSLSWLRIFIWIWKWLLQREKTGLWITPDQAS